MYMNGISQLEMSEMTKFNIATPPPDFNNLPLPDGKMVGM
jgi:hypothetical protein